MDKVLSSVMSLIIPALHSGEDHPDSGASLIAVRCRRCETQNGEELRMAILVA